jgi:hypothetical protein
MFDLDNEENWRKDDDGNLPSTFGISTKDFHMCILHGQKRQNDKMISCTFTFAYMFRAAIQYDIEEIEATIDAVLKADVKRRADIRKAAAAAAVASARRNIRRRASSDNDESDSNSDGAGAGIAPSAAKKARRVEKTLAATMTERLAFVPQLVPIPVADAAVVAPIAGEQSSKRKLVLPPQARRDSPETYWRRRSLQMADSTVFTMADLPRLRDDVDLLKSRLDSIKTTKEMAQLLVDLPIGRHAFVAEIKPTKYNKDRYTCKTSTLDGNQSDLFLDLNHKCRKVKHALTPGQAVARDNRRARSINPVQCVSCEKICEGERGVLAHLRHCRGFVGDDNHGAGPDDQQQEVQAPPAQAAVGAAAGVAAAGVPRAAAPAAGVAAARAPRAAAAGAGVAAAGSPRAAAAALPAAAVYEGAVWGAEDQEDEVPAVGAEDAEANVAQAPVRAAAGVAAAAVGAPRAAAAAAGVAASDAGVAAAGAPRAAAALPGVAAVAAVDADAPKYPPYWLWILNSLGDCGHSDAAKQSGSLGADYCGICNNFAAYYIFAEEIMPVLQSLTMEEIHSHSPNGVWIYEDFNARNNYLGKLLVLTFSHVCTSVISIYGHLIFDHSGFFLKRDGPLAAWSNQAVEHVHKDIKSSYTQGTNHDGGRAQGNNSSLSQVMFRSMRILVAELRFAAARPSDDPSVTAWRQFILSQVVPFSLDEIRLAKAASANMERRVKNIVCRQMLQPNVQDELDEAAEAADFELLAEGVAEAEPDEVG